MEGWIGRIGIPCLEDAGLEVVDKGRERVCDAGDDVGKNLAQLELLDDAVSVGVKDSKEGDDGVLEAIAHGKVSTRWVKELEANGEDRQDFVVRDISVSIRICRK